MSKSDTKTLKVVFNGTKNEAIASDGKQYTKFVSNLVRQFAGVSYITSLTVFICLAGVA